jgi:hypothetical protein
MPTMDVRVPPPSQLNRLTRSLTTKWQPLGEPGVTGISVRVLRYDTAPDNAHAVHPKGDCIILVSAPQVVESLCGPGR